MSTNKTSIKRKRLGDKKEDDDTAAKTRRKIMLKVINLEKTTVRPDLHFEYRAGKPYGASAPAGARGHTPGHLVYYGDGKQGAFVGVRFLVGKEGALCHSVYTDNADTNKFTFVVGVPSHAAEYLKKLLSSLPNLPKGTIPDKFYMQTGTGTWVKLKCKTVPGTTYVNRDPEARAEEVTDARDLVGSELQIVCSLRFNTTPTGKTSVSVIARSVVVLKKGRRSVVEEDHDELVAMAI